MLHAPLWGPDLTQYPRAQVPDVSTIYLTPWRVLTRDDVYTGVTKRFYREKVGIEDPQLAWFIEQATGLRVLASMDPTARFGVLLHVSISYAKHAPSWDEIKLVKEVFFGPERDAIMVLAADRDWVNVQEHCFHLSEAPERWGMR